MPQQTASQLGTPKEPGAAQGIGGGQLSVKSYGLRSLNV